MDLPLPDSLDAAAPTLIPAVRPHTAPANAWLVALDRAEAALVREPLAPLLDALVVLDLPELRLFVNQGHRDRWGATEAQVLAAARTDLPEPDVIPWDLADGVLSVHAADLAPSTYLAMPGFIERFADRVRGAPIALCPTVDQLWIVGSEAGLPLQLALEAAFRDWTEAGTPVSPVPYQAGPLTPWQPGRDHPLVYKVGVAKRFFAGQAYRDQAAALAAWLIDKGDPTWVAPLSLIRHRSGRVVSFAHWPDGPTLLPPVDLVVLGPPGPTALDDHPVIPWPALVALGWIGPAEPGLIPPRHRVERHPDLARCRGLAVDPRAYDPDRAYR